MFVLATAGYGSGTQSTPSDDTPPVPFDGLPWPGGGSAVYLHRQMVVARTAADRLQRFPDSPHTVAWLSQAHRLDDALRVLERVVQRQPERLPEALTGLDTSEIQQDQARGYRARARGVLDEARKKLPGLNRERAAAVAWSLLGLEQATADRYEEFGQRLDRYLKEDGDTEAGRLQQVEEMTQGRLTLTALADLDALAASVPGTEVAAKARDLLQPLLGNRRAERLIDTVWQIERVRDIRALRPLLRGGQLHVAADGERRVAEQQRVGRAHRQRAADLLLPLHGAERQDGDLPAHLLVPAERLLDRVLVEEVHNLLDPLGVDAQIRVNLDRVIAGDLLHTYDDVHSASLVVTDRRTFIKRPRRSGSYQMPTLM